MTNQSGYEQSRARALLTAMSAFFYKHWIASLIFFVTLVFAGILSYTTLLNREGFPSIQFPLTVAQGTYFVNDKSLVDLQITEPLNEALSEIDEVDSVNTSAGDNFFSALVFFESDVTPEEGADIVDSTFNTLDLPPQATYSLTPIDPAGYLNEFDLLVSVYSTDTTISVSALEEDAQVVASRLAEDDNLARAEVQTLIETGQDPRTAQAVEQQTAFNLIGLPNEQGQIEYYPAVTVGVDKTSAIDILELSNIVESDIANLEREGLNSDTQAVIGAEQGDSIETQIASLESNLLTGILAVAIVSLLLISWRASAVTAIFMASVVVVSTLVLLLIGSTLNTITLFGLILALGLFVDDATIIVEAIDASRDGKGKAINLLRRAISRVALASFAGTLTTVLVFLPLAFVGGILGEFIRILPITVIIALVTSLLLSLTLIPFLSRFTVLTKAMAKRDAHDTKNPILRAERYFAGGLADIIGWVGERSKRGVISASIAVLFSFLMIGGAIVAAQNVDFNIFPDSKDANQVLVTLDYEPGTTLEQAEAISQELNTAIDESIGSEVRKVVYGGFTQPNERRADLVIELTPFTDRSLASPALIADLESAASNIGSVQISITQLDAGPPAEDFPFKVQIYEDDPVAAENLANDIAEYLLNADLQRMNGDSFAVVETKLDGTDLIVRQDGRRLIELSASFNADDVSALVTATEDAVREGFNVEELEQRGFGEDTLGFDFGQESENAESFNALGLVFPIALAAMFIVLGLQFRSFVQPLLIFMAIPFSLFGVFNGLILTDNPLSFFSVVGLIGLIGIAVNNTILLVDYANQERNEGRGIVESIATATKRRFRPLLATTLTTIAALLPLALADPFWESLAYTIIFGLLSSTILVILSFPYYYMAIEKMRQSTKHLYRKARKGA